MYCVNCGQDIADNSTFCPHCGAPQTVAETVEQPATPPEPEGATPGESQQEQSQGYQQGQSYQQSQSYQQAPPAAAPVNDSRAIISLCCGVFSVITLFTGWGTLLGIVAAIAGLVIGVKARKENPCTMATVGVILCVCGLVVCALVFLACVACVGGLGLLSAVG